MGPGAKNKQTNNPNTHAHTELHYVAKMLPGLLG